MKRSDAYFMVLAALAAVLGAHALIFAAHRHFETYRPQSSVAILESLPANTNALAFGLNGAGSKPRRYQLGNVPLEVSGWAYDRQTMAPFLGGAVFIDGRPQRIVYGTVAQAAAVRAGTPSLVRTGWYVRFPPGSLKPGSHVVTFAFVCDDGTRVDEARDVATIVSDKVVSRLSR